MGSKVLLLPYVAVISIVEKGGVVEIRLYEGYYCPIHLLNFVMTSVVWTEKVALGSCSWGVSECAEKCDERIYGHELLC